MGAHKIEIAPELVAEGKRLYELTQTPLSDIAAGMGICRRTLENRIREWNWQRCRVASGPIELAHAVRGRAITDDRTSPADRPIEPMSPQRRTALAERIQDVADREIAAVERVLELLGPSDRAEAAQAARTLASLSRTLREVAALNQPTEAAPSDETDDDCVPSDIDEFRYELARRIRLFVEARRQRSQGSGDGVFSGMDGGDT